MQRLPSNRDALYELPEYVGLLGRVAANVRRLREARGWTQDEAADRCVKMGTLVYAGVERAEGNFTALTLARLAIGFEVDAQTLLEPAPAPPPRAPGRPKKAPAATPTAESDASAVAPPKDPNPSRP